MKKKIDKYLIGQTGEYFVAGMMHMKGWVASLTLKNYPSVDIFGLNPENNQAINIQVKTTKDKITEDKTTKMDSYNIGVMRSQIDYIEDKITCPFVFVHIDKNNSIRYFITPKQELIDLILKTDNDYYNRPRKTPLKDYPIAVSLKYLRTYEDKWENLWI
jgi:hypothetical protein